MTQPSPAIGYTAVPARYVPPGFRTLYRLQSSARTAPVGAAASIGHQITFLGLVLAAVPRTIRHYRRQIGAQLLDVVWGNGSIIVGGGSIGMLLLMGVSIGASMGVVGFATLDLVGLGPLVGFVSAYGNTREMAPLITALGFAAQTGCRITAEVGAMRISEEIDAIEAQGIQSIPFVVTTRVIAGVVSIIPLFVMTLLLGYLSCAFVVNVVHGEASGTYYHYFDAFVHPMDVVYAILKAVIFVVAVIVIHSYQGYYASGGPEGVGVAAGRAIRTSLIAIIVLDMILTLVLWGDDGGLRISG
ncbi:MAG: MlaE family ABC transporter permease [Segniliparus sp.]|uniref:MlaE family ABC transporter permease n=1 Tax=Segniliparus sp. TaxID=2804064 RepID=UPI003F36B23D